MVRREGARVRLWTRYGIQDERTFIHANFLDQD
jgi:hypothetical protein